MNSLHLFIPRDYTDIILTLILFCGISLYLVISELLHRYFRVQREILRKGIHILTGIFIVLAGIWLDHPFPIIAIATFFTLFNFILIKSSSIKGLSHTKDTLGTVFYPIAVLLLILYGWEDYKALFLIAVLLLAVADAFAAIIGEHINNPHKFKIWNDAKSIEGSFVMFLASFTIILISATILIKKEILPAPGLNIWLVCFISAFFITVSEMISSKGSDNLNVPIISVLSLKIFFYDSTMIQTQFLWAQLFAVIAGLASYGMRFLNFAGAVSAYFIAVLIYGIGGWSWTIPILVFFILSSFLSKIGKNHKRDMELLFEKGSIRDSQQVLANGGLATIWALCFYVTNNNDFYLMYVATLAAATADTWGTELGAFSSGTRLITTFKKVNKGQSGGISIIGTSGSIAGSLVIAISASYYLKLYFESSQVLNLLIKLAVAGFLGAVLDSVLGASVQAQYRCGVCGKLTEKKEHCLKETTITHGYEWLNNDMVNFAATSFSAIVIYLIV